MQLQQAIFGAGCFWHVEHYFSKIKGVKSTSVGYSGGNTKNPKYSDVCTGLTGHIEVVKVIFDTKIITYDKCIPHLTTLLIIFMPNILIGYHIMIIFK